MSHRSRTRHVARLEGFVALLLAFVLAFAGCESRSAEPAPTAERSSSARASAAPSSGEPASAAPSVPTPVAASAAPAEPVGAKAQPFLWEVRKGAATSWLFGTMHLGTDAEKELNPVVFERLGAARTVGFEADVFDVDPLEMAAKMMLPPGDSVASKLTPGRWELVVARLGSFLMPESALERMKPWVLAAMLTQDMLPKTDPMDKVLYDRAKAAKKPVVFLEAVNEQITILEKALGVRELDDMLGDLPTMEKMTKELARAYQQGDMPALLSTTFDPVEMKKHPALFDSVLFERNRNWVPKLTAEFDKGGAFIAVGAAHLIGDKSVVALLEAKGFSLTRVAVR